MIGLLLFMKFIHNKIVQLIDKIFCDCKNIFECHCTPETHTHKHTHETLTYSLNNQNDLLKKES